MGEARPIYLNEVFVLHALRVLHDWITGGHVAQEPLRGITIHAGDYKTIGALDTWYTKGALELKTAAATPIIEEVRRMPEWLEVNVALAPLRLPMDAPETAELPSAY